MSHPWSFVFVSPKHYDTNNLSGEILHLSFPKRLKIRLVEKMRNYDFKILQNGLPSLWLSPKKPSGRYLISQNQGLNSSYQTLLVK